jgi:hypothetical protein
MDARVVKADCNSELVAALIEEHNKATAIIHELVREKSIDPARLPKILQVHRG